MEEGEEVVNAMNNLIDPSAVTAIGTSLTANVQSLAPAIVGVMSIMIIVGIVFKLVKKVRG